MKRTLDDSINENTSKKRRKYKYEYTPDMKNTSVPLHYIYDRLATDEQIEELEKHLDLRKNIYTDMGNETSMLIDSLYSDDKSELDRIIFGMIDDNCSIWEIIDEIDFFLDEH
jgi:hypothetical protein